MIFKSAISTLNKYLIGMVCLVLIGTTIPVFGSEGLVAGAVLLSINGLTLTLLIWIYFKTYYSVDNHLLLCKSGPFFSKIDIKTIKKIEHHKGIYVPVIWKPALSHIGLIITYNNYDDIYISPENETLFLEKLLIINPNIQIIPLPKS
ncbi:PH domain-containing protein [Flavobacterium chuncheonense]|uniref:PH domain-containing protein n=1 Tax=Flavobacterium chuncheonense TaxID=2026653 RepID=A0ABW5YJS8_9FLAO